MKIDISEFLYVLLLLLDNLFLFLQCMGHALDFFEVFLVGLVQKVQVVLDFLHLVIQLELARSEFVVFFLLLGDRNPEPL